MNDIEDKGPKAEVTAVFPNKVVISVDDLDSFASIDSQVEKLRVGSYLEVSDNENNKLIVVIENYSIIVQENGERRYLIEANPLGTLIGDEFIRGGESLTIPPTAVRPAKRDDVIKIYESNLGSSERFCFSNLSQDKEIEVPINGNRFFNKHFAVVGSTGSGKSHSVAQILQKAVSAKKAGFEGLNNSHIVIFDIHSEYRTAFPNAICIGIEDLVLPYWLLNSEELEELFIDTEANDHNQRNIFKESIVSEKIANFKGDESERNKIHYDSPLFFDIEKVLAFAQDKNSELTDTGETYASGAKKGQKKLVQGSLFGKLTNFVSRLENKINDKRLDFLLGKDSKSITFEDTLRQFLSYGEKESNVTIIDLSGIPFEVLSVTVSLISRILFDYGFFYKKLLDAKGNDCETPLLLVYEEAHKYVPRSELVRYRASKTAIERIAKEGRKYGVTLGIVSQRPSEISETIFSQCNNFIAMRVTNPNDQNYVKKLLPDTLGNLTEALPALQCGEALLIGESIVLPSLVKIHRCDPEPKSSDIKYYEIWKEKWQDVLFKDIVNKWVK